MPTALIYRRGTNLDSSVIVALLITAGALVFAPAPHAAASPCLHRGTTHVAQHANGNVDADSRWHVLHGEAPTCDTAGGPSDTESAWDERQDSIDRERHGHTLN